MTNYLCVEDKTVEVPTKYNEVYEKCIQSLSIGKNNKIIFDIDRYKQNHLNIIRTQRNKIFKDFDGLMLGYERDNNESMVTECVSLRQSLKQAPQKAEKLLNNAITIKKVESITLQSLLISSNLVLGLLNG
ncbi:MAG: hypothetical protein GY793_09275 [Proteobacteria bacterium]|nr:hypothetical protein [Pseudomonadota bacterium]